MHHQKLNRFSSFLFQKEVLKILSLLHVVSCAKSVTTLSPDVQTPPPPRTADSIKAAFEKHKVVPDVIDEAPNQTLEIAFQEDNYVDLGNYLVPTLWETKPTKVRFAGAQKDRMYVLIMTEPDHPSQSKASGKEWYHWVVGDIPGADIRRGKTAMVYVGPIMKDTSGMHRVVFLLYEQLDGRIFYEEKHMSATSNCSDVVATKVAVDNYFNACVKKLPIQKLKAHYDKTYSKNEKKRARHSTRKFAEKYNLTGPWAGNFFTTGYNY